MALVPYPYKKVQSIACEILSDPFMKAEFVDRCVDLRLKAKPPEEDILKFTVETKKMVEKSLSNLCKGIIEDEWDEMVQNVIIYLFGV